MRCVGLARIIIYGRRIFALLAILSLIISFFLPWYSVKYTYENLGDTTAPPSATSSPSLTATPTSSPSLTPSISPSPSPSPSANIPATNTTNNSTSSPTPATSPPPPANSTNTRTVKRYDTFTTTATGENYEVGRYTSGAYIHPWYIYQNVHCNLPNCSGHPGALFTEEGLTLWIIGINDGRFGMRLLFLVSWGLIVAAIPILLISIIRSNKGKIIAYAAFVLCFISTIVFILLPTSFTPCTWTGLKPGTGPCHAFVGKSNDGPYSTFSWGPYAGWITTLIAAIFTCFALSLAIIAPKPYYSDLEDEEQQRLKDNFWK